MPFVVPLNDTPQPVPTGGALSIIARANSSTPYAGGGGGGPSTITSTFNQLFVSSIGTTAPSSNDFAIVGNGTNLVFDMSSGTLNQIQFQLSSSIGIGGDVPEISVIDTGGNGYTMSLNGAGGANVLVSISSLNVSSINGAAPGGGSVPANLELSSLTLGLPGVITGVSSLVGGGGILSVGDQLAVSSITGLGGALLLDGAGYAINVAGSAVNILAAPTTISTLLVSSINGAAPGGSVPDPLTLSSLSVSSINGGVPAVFQFKDFTGTLYQESGVSTILGPTYYSLVNGVGNLVITMPETPGATWAGDSKYIKFGPNFLSGGMPSTWNIDNAWLACPNPGGVGAYLVNSWASQVGGNQLTWDLTLGGSPSTFAITAQVRLP